MIEFNTDKLETAASEAGKAAKECNEYANALETKILKNINSYSGERGANISVAQIRINAKKRKLTEKSQSFQSYQKQINQFKTEVKSQEERLQGRVKSLYGSFDKRYHSNSEKGVLDYVSDALACLLPWDRQQIKNFLFNSTNRGISWFEKLRNWYKYKGGKEIITAIGLAVGAIIAVVSIVLNILAVIATGGWWLIALVPLTVGLLCAMATASVQLAYIIKSFEGSLNGKTHLAGRSLFHAEEEDAGDFLRRIGQYDAANWFNLVDTVSAWGMFVFDLISGNLIKETFIGNVKKKVDFIKAGCGVLEGVNKILSGDYEAGIGKLIDGVIKPIEDIKPITKIFSIVKDVVEDTDKIIKTYQHFATPDIFHFTYDAKPFKLENVKLFDTEFKIKNFTSIGKIVEGSIKQIDKSLELNVGTLSSGSGYGGGFAIAGRGGGGGGGGRW